MPNQLSLIPPGLLQITHDPTKTINGNPMGFVGDNPYGQMTEAVIFGAVNSLLTMIDDVTGLDLLAMVTPLESLLGTSTGLLSGLVGFVNPGIGTAGGGVFGPLLGLIPGLGGGTGTLGGLGSFLNPTTLLAGGGVFGPLISLIPGVSTLGGLGGFLNPTTLLAGGGVFGPLISLIPGVSTLGGLGGFLQPTNLLTGAGVLGPLLSGGSILGSLIPGLDASKIISGAFPLSMITGLLSGGLINTSLIPGLSGLLSGLGLGSLSDLAGLLTAFPLGNISGLLSGGTILGSLLPAIPAGLIFGSILPANLPLISAAHIGNTSPNLLVNSTFDSASAVSDPGGIWTYDGTVGHTTNGSVKVIANGVGQKDLLSNLIPVTQGQTLDLSAYVQWASIVFTGAPLVLGVTAYLNGAAVAQPNIATLAPNTPTSTWQHLSGSYSVPSGVDNVRVRVSVLTGATAGTVWYDDITASKSGVIPTGLIGDSNGLLSTQLGGIGTDITSLFSGLGARALQSDFSNLLTSLGGGSGGFTTIENRLLGFLTPSSVVNAGQIGGTGSIAAGFIPDLSITRDNIVTQFLNLGGSGYSNTDVQAALQQHTAALTGLASQVATLNNTLTTGVSFGDDFEYAAGAMNSNWSVTYPSGTAGTIHTDGHYLAYQPSGTSDRVYVARWNANQTSTNYQLVQAIFGAAPQVPGLLPPGTPAGNGVCARMNVANTDYVYALWLNGKCSLIRVVSGIETLLNQVDWPTPSAGSTMALQAGKPGTGTRIFIPMINGQRCMGEFTEVGTASMVDASHLYTGVYGKAGAWPLALTQSSPGKLNQFAGADL